MTKRVTAYNGDLTTTSDDAPYRQLPVKVLVERQESRNGAKRTGLFMSKPQISIDEAPSDGAQSPTTSPLGASKPTLTHQSPRNDSLLQVTDSPTMSKSMKSNSLPAGLLLKDLQRTSSSSCDTPESDSASSDGQHPGNDSNFEPSYRYQRDDMKTRSYSVDSGSRFLDSSSDDDSSDELSNDSPPNKRKFTTSPSMDTSHGDQDDDVFRDGDLDVCAEADTKLMDWAFSMFVPTCRTLLNHCAEEKVTTEDIKLDLRNVSNTISFFCAEHQKISTLLKPQKGMRMSISAHNFSRLDKPERLAEIIAKSSVTSVMSVSSVSSSSSSVLEDTVAEQSYAVKVLRSISASLIVPLLAEASKGFTPELYKAIVIALQKISWKVEACLSYNSCQPGQEFAIHAEIFSIAETVRVRDMMIKALPPEEPKLQTAAQGSRHNSVSLRKAPEPPPLPTISLPEGYVPLRKTSNGKNRPSGVVFDGDDDLPKDLKEIAYSEEEVTLGDSHEDRPRESTPKRQVRRVRTSTLGDSESVTKIRYGSSSNLDDEDKNEEEYFRPKTYRRTTISLSRIEVHRLGLTVAKRIDESILKDIREMEASERKQKPLLENKVEGDDLEKVQDKLHAKLTQEFDRLRRSASMSDVLDQDEEVSKPLSNGALTDEQGSETPTSVASPITLTYVSTQRHKRSQSETTEWILGDKPSPRSKSKKTKEKKPVGKSLSSSGKFTNTLKKTARALRRGSTSVNSTPRKSNSFHHVDSEKQPETPDPSGPRSSSVLSEPSSLNERSTLPSSKTRMNTLSRLLKRRREKAISRSFGKVDAIASKKSSFARWTQDFDSTPGSSGGVFTESIENFSKDASRLLQLQGEEQLLVSVDVAGKLPKSKAHGKRSSSFYSKESSHTWYEITVTTNMKQFGRNHYTILRPFKEVQKLYDAVASSHVGLTYELPERPDKKIVVKKQRQQMEEFLRCIAGNSELRSSQAFVSFLMPDDAFGSFTENESEVSFELLMTFYTPDVYSGPPGSNHAIQMVTAEDVPMPPSNRRKHSSFHHKRGSLHLMKRDGKEDPSTFVIREEGKDALIVAYEEERYVVVAGTFEKLVEHLACEEKPDPRFVTTFLLGYRHFATSMDCLTMLLKRFHMTIAPDAPEEEMAYAEKWSYVIQLRVLDILVYWLRKCWPDFYRNPALLDKVREFIQYLKSSSDTNFKMAGGNVEKIVKEKLATSAQYALPLSPKVFSKLATGSDRSDSLAAMNGGPVNIRHSIAVNGPLRHASSTLRHASSTSSAGNVDVCTLTAIQLARQLTLIELEILRTIDTHELVVYTWEPNSPENKPYRRNLDASIARFNKVSYWVASEICSVHDARVRGALIEKFIEIAKHCHEYKNFNTMMSVLSGLSLAAVRRLKRSWEHVSEKATKSFDKLSPVISPSMNHCNYRKALASVHRRDPCIPYVGVFMRDLTFFNDGNQKTLRNGLINFSKLRTIVLKFEELKRYQRSKYFFPPEDKTREFCRNLWCMQEQDLYDTSLSMEPRDPPSSDSPVPTH